MNEKSNSAQNGGLGFAGALFLVFLVLKLLNKIAWSWLWVTFPLWLSPTLYLVLVGLGCAMVGMDRLIKKARSRR